MEKEQRRAQMKMLVEQWRESGVSRKSFAESHKIGYHTFLYWANKFKQEGTSGENQGFIELSSVPMTAIVIRYPNGVEINLPGNVPLAYIKSLSGQ